MSSILRCFTAGSVDDGKSTLLGRLLFEAGAVPDDVLSSVHAASGQQLDFSLITDGLQAEREQRITIDVAYRYLRSQSRVFIFADTPGHEEYTRNMATAASTAEVALLLVDVTKGLLPQTHRHAFIAWLFGIRDFVVAVNKMDMVAFAEPPYRQVEGSMQTFLARLGHCRLHCVPTAARTGENLTHPSPHTPWFHGAPILSLLQRYQQVNAASAPPRFLVQRLLHSPTGERRYAGRVLSGTLRTGDAVAIFPGDSPARVESIYCGDELLSHADNRRSISLTLSGSHEVSRGTMLAAPSHPPIAASRPSATLIWTGDHLATAGAPFILKHATGECEARITRLRARVDPTAFARSAATAIECNDIVEADLTLSSVLFYDPYSQNRSTGAAILIDPASNATVAAVLIAGSLTPSGGTVVWLTGLSSAGKSTLARLILEQLNAQHYETEWLDGDAMRSQLGTELGFSRADRGENIRRIGFLAATLARHGVTVIVSAISPYRADRDAIRAQVPDFVEVFVDAPLAVCEQRDVKGLYQRARAGQIHNLTGLDDPYEPPLAPEVVCHTDRETPAESAGKIAAALTIEP